MDCNDQHGVHNYKKQVCSSKFQWQECPPLLAYDPDQEKERTDCDHAHGREDRPWPGLKEVVHSALPGSNGRPPGCHIPGHQPALGYRCDPHKQYIPDGK